MRSTIVLALALAAAQQAVAQSDPQTSTSTLKVYARETVVDITVTDGHGNPVHGLPQQEFTVKEDGKPQPIRSFEEFSSTSVPAPAHKLPANVYTNFQPPAPSSAVNLLLLDGLNTAPPDAADPAQIGFSFSVQARVKQEAIRYVRTMPPGTRIAVLGLSRNLRLLQGFTSDPELLAAAIDTMDMNMDGRASTGAQWCVQQDVRNRATLEALRQIAADVPAIKGKKNLIWFSAGFPTITDPSVTQAPDCRSGPTPVALRGIEDQTQALLKVYALFNAAQIAVFPIAARGNSSQVMNPVGPGAVIDLARPPAMVLNPTDRAYLNAMAVEQLSLESMAEATGGTAFYNTNDLAGAVAKAIDAGANHYTLTYVPPGKKFDWGHHTIKVTLNHPDQPGLHLVYRKTYDAVDPTTIKPAPGLTLANTLPAPLAPAGDPPDPAALMRVAMSRSLPLSTDLLFDVQVQPSTEPAKPSDAPIFGVLDAKLQHKPLIRYGFEYIFPARQVLFASTAQGNQKFAVEFDIAVYDTMGNLVSSLSQSIDPIITPAQHDQLVGGPFRFFQQLDLPSGEFFLRVGILDATAAKAGTVEIPLTVPKK